MVVIAAGDRGGTAGFGEGVKVGSWAYLCTQFWAILHYLKLCVWPHPLVLDYGTETVRSRLRSCSTRFWCVCWRWPH